MVVRAYYHPTPRKYTMNDIDFFVDALCDDEHSKLYIPEMGRLGYVLYLIVW